MSYIKELLNNRTPKKIKLINLERYNIIASKEYLIYKENQENI